MRRSIDRCDVNNLELAGLAKFLAQLVTDPRQSFPLVWARPIDFAIKARVDHLEIEHRKLRRLGGLGECPARQHQKYGSSERSHDRDLQNRDGEATQVGLQARTFRSCFKQSSPPKEDRETP
jgi:hypothetical protein